MRGKFLILSVAAALLAACGGGGGSYSDTTPPPTNTPTLALLAGNVGGPGSVDGAGAAARFNTPHGIAIDPLGNLYVADFANSLIRKITPAGVVTTFAGTAGNVGSADGIGAAASFTLPKAIALDAAGNLYVGDWSNYIVRRITPAGVVTTIAGRLHECGGVDGPVATATFCFIEGVATDAGGNVFVSTGSAMRRISPAGFVTTYAGATLAFGSVDGPASQARFSEPSGIASDAGGNLFVADSANRAIRKVAPDGMVTTVAGLAGATGSVDGTGSAARFVNPLDVAADRFGNVFVADAGIDGNTIRRISPGAVVTTIAGMSGQRGSADGIGTAARFDIPVGVAADADGNVFVADSFNHTIRRITPSGTVTTLAGSAAGRGSVDGTGTTANFAAPEGIGVAPGGDVFVADGDNRTIRRISPQGVVATVAGDASAPASSVDGVGTQARFIQPTGLAVDAAGNVYVGDVRCAPRFSKPPVDPCSGTIRRVSPGGTVTTLAGTAGVWGSADGIGAAASFREPRALAVDAAGVIYVADRGAHTIRKVDASGAVTTLAGLADSQGDSDGTGSSARFAYPSGITVEAAGNIVVTDGVAGLQQKRVRRITPAGVVTTIESGGLNSDHSALAADADGNLYIADQIANVVRKRTATGTLTTVVGIEGQATFEPGPLPGRISLPAGLAVRGTDLYITTGNGIAVVRNRP